MLSLAPGRVGDLRVETLLGCCWPHGFVALADAPVCCFFPTLGMPDCLVACDTLVFSLFMSSGVSCSLSKTVCIPRS